MNPFKSLLRLLKDTSVSKIELSATPPFVKIVFDREELLEILQGRELVAAAIAEHFVGRRVFWENFISQITPESENYVLKSLEQAEKGLIELCSEVSAKREISTVGLAKFLRSWASACKLSGKGLKERLDKMELERGQVPNLPPRQARAALEAALKEVLVSLRQTVYPLITALVGFLPDDDPTKQQAQQKLDEGLKLIADMQLQRESSLEVIWIVENASVKNCS